MAALTPWASTAAFTKERAQCTTLVMKGMGTTEVYPVEVDQTTGAIPVEGVSGGVPIPVTPTQPSGRSTAFLAKLGFASNNVSNSAYTLVSVTPTAAQINELFVAETSGTFMILAVSTSNSGGQVDTLYMGPGGNAYDVLIAAGSYIWLKNNDVTVTSTTTGQISFTGLT